MSEEQNKNTREIIYKQLELLQEKSRAADNVIDLIGLSEQMSKLANVLMSKDYNELLRTIVSSQEQLVRNEQDVRKICAQLSLLTDSSENNL